MCSMTASLLSGLLLTEPKTTEVRAGEDRCSLNKVFFPLPKPVDKNANCNLELQWHRQKIVKYSNLQLCHTSHFVQVNIIAIPIKNNANISTNEPWVVIESWDKVCNLYIEIAFMSAFRLVLFFFPRSFKINRMTQSYWLEICSFSTCPLKIKKILKDELIALISWKFSIFLNVTLNINILFIETLALRLILDKGKTLLIHYLNQPLDYWEEHRYFTDWIIVGANSSENSNTPKHAACFISGHQHPLFCSNVEGEEGNRALMSQEDKILQSSEWLWNFVVWLTGEEEEEGNTTATHLFYIYILLF